MKTLFTAANISRQAYHQWQHRKVQQPYRTDKEAVLALAKQIRKKYLPGSSARQVYSFIRKTPDLSTQLIGWGKHDFENLCLNNGLRVKKLRFIPKTTQHGAYVFPNRIAGKEINDINTIFVSDISYIYGIEGKLIGYVTTLMDLYSRFLVGLSFSQTMQAIETSVPVLKQAIRLREKNALHGSFFHSDGGKQYIYKEFISLLNQQYMTSSMAKSCYENPFAEALNDTLKNHMLFDMNINSFYQLKKKENFIKNVYNYNKIHTGIGGLTPAEYEQQLKTLKPCQRTNLIIKEIL